jgi:hypothetical protein
MDMRTELPQHRGLILPVFVLLAVWALARAPQGVSAADPPAHSLSRGPVPSSSVQTTPEPDAMADPFERLAAPPMSDPPTQIELGHAQYHLSCMVCHGDRGQGLTEEWRSVLDPADRNCWQSKCHAPNHPPEGFEIPRSAPPVIGPGTLGAFSTAADLYAYLRVKMPWPFPGLFDDDEYWRLTAFLARANQVDLGDRVLSADSAASVLMRAELPQSHHTPVKTERAVTVAVLVLVLGGAGLYRVSRSG